MYKEKLSGLFKTIGFANPIEVDYQPLVAIKSFHALTVDHPEWQMKIIGFGSQYSEILKYVKENDLGQKIMLYGSVSDSEIYDVFKRVDIVVVPSKFSNENDSTLRISSLGTPIVIHEEYKSLDINNINQAIITHDGTIGGVTEKLDLAINSIGSFDSNFIIKERSMGLLKNKI